MKRFSFIHRVFLVCSLAAVLFSSAPAQAENPSECFASSVVAFFDSAPDAPVLLAEAPVLLPVVFSEAGLTVAETVNFSDSTGFHAEQERWGWFKRALRWLCKAATDVSTWLSGSNYGEEERYEGCEDRWG